MDVVHDSEIETPDSLRRENISKDTLEGYRSILFRYAYNILGVVEESEDIVQDAFVKFMSSDTSSVINAKAYLIRTVINLAINCKKRQKRMLVVYPGEWLPEPVAIDNADSGLERKEILSYSLMVLLERLNAKQRAVFILKEAFDYDHAEIADVINIKEENSRQLLSRAKKLVATETKPPLNAEYSQILEKYLQVIKLGNIKQLEDLLLDDVMVVSDGGGKASAGKHPVCGRKDAMAMLLGLYNKFYTRLRLQIKNVNNQPALLYYDGEILTTCQIISIENGRIHRVFFLRNPDKLGRLQKLI